MMTEVASRSSADLLPHLEEWVESGSRIDSDGLRSYSPLGDRGFTQGVVEHKHHFVNPADGVHTQRIESMWHQLRLWLDKHHYVCGDRRDDYVKEFCFRYNRGHDAQRIWTSLFPA
jgi:transposase-like protein